jgi:hypothetical protein
MLCVGWWCGGVKVLPLLCGFSCKVYLQHLSKTSFQEACFLLPPSSHHLGIEIGFSLLMDGNVKANFSFSLSFNGIVKSNPLNL